MQFRPDVIQIIITGHFFKINIEFISDGPYAGFAGRDASRGLATFSVEAITDEYDDLLDLKASEIEQVCSAPAQTRVRLRVKVQVCNSKNATLTTAQMWDFPVFYPVDSLQSLHCSEWTGRKKQ